MAHIIGASDTHWVLNGAIVCIDRKVTQGRLTHLMLLMGVLLTQVATDGTSPAPSLTTAHPDLICYVCNANRADCPVVHYKFPVAHLETSCYGCYKEWKEGVLHATRKCLSKSNLTEFTQKVGNTSVAWSGCSSKTDHVNSKPIYFCLCTEDYCNTASTHKTALTTVLMVSTICYLSWLTGGVITNG